MRSAGVAFLLSTTVAALLTPVVRNLAIRYNLLDAVNTRKVHGRPVPRLGGLAIIAGFYAPLVGMALYETGVGMLFYSQLRTAIALMVSGVAIALLGVYDDVRGANAIKKFSVQIALAIFLYFMGFRIEQIATPFGGTVTLGIFALPFTVVWIVGVINALNLIDGLDGLAGGVALFAIGTTFIIAFLRGDPMMMLFMACLGGGVLGFLFYNFNPASIFMGDTGSMFLGLILAAGSIQSAQKSSTAVAILIPIVVLGLPIADTLLAMARRAASGRSLFTADKEHIHHRLMALGFSHRKAVVVLYAASVALAGFALLLTFANSTQAAILLAVLALCFLVSVRSLGFLRLERATEVKRIRKRNQRLRASVRTAGRLLARARNHEQFWEAISPLAKDLNVCELTISLEELASNEHRACRSFEFSDPGSDAKPFRASFEIVGREKPIGSIEMLWSDGRQEIDRDEEIAIELLCEHIAEGWQALIGEGFGGGRDPLSPENGKLSVLRS
jgi:UDP-GlcNAc:undecaprenyl-phosphate/decaprenyl-phosphate GlcNAc-1-phosphate transferase